MNRLFTAMAVALALAFGSVLVFEGAMADVQWLGELFLRALKMLVVPVIIFSIIAGVTRLGETRNLARLGGRALLYYLITTFAAVTVGVVLVSLIRPGVVVGGLGLGAPDEVAAAKAIGVPDLFLGFLSDDMPASLAALDVLPLIVFSLVFGAVLSSMGEKARPIVAFCEAGHAAMMRIVGLLMWFAPVGVFGLVAGRFGAAVAEGGMEAFRAQLGATGAYLGTVLAALAVHAFVVLPLILWFTTRRNPLTYLSAVGSALLTAFATASSVATLPATLQAVEDRADVDTRSSRFVVSLGAVLNMDGTALYETVAVLFIAQALGVDLSVGQVLLVVLTAAVVSMGAAGVPHAGLVTMVLVLRAVDLPVAGVELILAADWLVDRFRTAVNVWGDSVGAAVVECKALQRGFVKSG